MKKANLCRLAVVFLSLLSLILSLISCAPAKRTNFLSEQTKENHVEMLNFIVAHPLNVSQIQRISKFRSCVGHDYSGLNIEGERENLRSMKHYVEPLPSLVGTTQSTTQMKIFAPFDGKISEIRESSSGSADKQVFIAADAAPGWNFIFFHVALASEIQEGTAVRAGEQIGTVSADTQHNFDIGLKHFGRKGQIFDSPFLHMKDGVLQEYEAKGVTPANIIISKQTRDADPCPVEGTMNGDARFTGPQERDFVTLNTPETAPKEIQNTSLEIPKKELISLVSTRPAPGFIPVDIPAEKPLTPEEKIWKQRIDKALESTFCPPVKKQTYPENYYQGPLTDTHLHIPAIPDWSLEEDNLAKNQGPEGRFGGPQALLGWNVKIGEIACTLKREGTHKNFAFFPVYEEIPLQLLEIWNRTMAAYPELFTPFIMSSGNDNDPNGFPTVDAETLEEMLAVYPKLFRGYGEIGLYERENGGSPELLPDSERLLEIYPLIRKHVLVVYFHLGEGHKDKFEKVLQQYPDIIFIWHGDQLSAAEIEDILSTYPNAYYGIDEFFGGKRDLFLMFVGESKEKYLETLNQRFNSVVEQAVRDWKPLIERHPNQVIWGTDRGDAVWNYDYDIGQMQVKLARAFIGRLDPAVQEKFAYKNAERLFSGTEKH